MDLPPLQHSALIFVGGVLNERCVGGHSVPSEPREPSAVARDMAVARARDRDARRVVLVGGEPTAHAGHLRAYLDAAGLLGLKAGLVTNGRMLLYPKMRELLLEGGVDYLRVGLHARAPHLHDALVGVNGAHGQARAGLEAWLAEAPGGRVDVACVVTAANLDQVPDLARMLAAMGGDLRPGLRLVAPRSATTGQWPRAAALRRLDALLDDPPLPLAWEGFSGRALANHEGRRLEDLRRDMPAFGPRAGAALCRLAPAPVGQPRANSFNLERLRELPGFSVDPTGCPALDLLPQLRDSPARHLLLEHPAGVMALYRTPTRDFDEAEVLQVKAQTEQLYLDTSEGAALGDLARHVARARIHPGCLTCNQRPACCTAAVVQGGDPFAAEERWLKRQLDGLRGRVLDVGCGEQPYRDRLRARAAKGQVEYHGLDPDRDALDTLAESNLSATLHCCGVEDFASPDGPYDHVLALRALNHLADLQRGLQVMADALAPGGRLLLSDMTVYALLRTPAQVETADTRGAGGQEHFRNCHSHEVLALCRELPLELVEHRPVTPRTSNEWFLLLERRR